MSDGRSDRWQDRRREINRCIEQMHSDGVNPTTRLLMKCVGGAPNTICRMLREWREKTGIKPPIGGPLKGTTPWNTGLTKDKHPKLARPGNGQNFLNNGKPWNAGVVIGPTDRKGIPLSEEHKWALRGYKPGRFIGERHWKWSGGKSRCYWRGSDWASVKRKIIERDGRCFICQKTHDEWTVDGKKVKKSLSVHHFIPWPVGTNQENNLVTLCISCHMLVEANVDENEKLRHQVHQKYGYSPDV